MPVNDSLGTIQDSHTGVIKSLLIPWTSDSAAGTVTQAIPKISGTILRVVCRHDVPGSLPTTGYALKLNDPNGAGVDILQNLLASVTVSTNVPVDKAIAYATSYLPVVVDDVLILTITGAGNSKQGSLRIYYQG